MISALLVSLALAAAPARAAAGPEALVEKAQAKMKSLDFEAALPLLEQALASPKLSPALRGTALISLGITHFNHHCSKIIWIVH